MPKIHDWNRVYWRNRSGDNVLNRLPDDMDFTEETLAVYMNQHGDTLSYAYAPEDAEADYAVYLNGSIVSDVTLDGEKFDEEHFDELMLPTRAAAREATTQLMRQLPTLEADEDGQFDYDALQEWAKVIGVPANLSREDLTEEVQETLGIEH